MKSLVFSGVQPTGNLHLGNYLGAIKNWVGLQHQHDCMFCIVDMHAITVAQEPEALRRAIRETAAAYIACGIDADKHIIFTQSTVSAHAELAWILNCHTPLGWLNRMTQFKEKSRQAEESIKGDLPTALNKHFNDMVKMLDDLIPTTVQPSLASALMGTLSESYYNTTVNAHSLKEQIELIKEGFRILKGGQNLQKKLFDEATLGLFAYPTLMAADILAYKATHVPVGADQKQHLELARDIAGAFNRAYPSPPPVGGRSGGGYGETGTQLSPLPNPPPKGEGIYTGFFPLPEPLILGEATRVMSLRDGTKKMSKSDESDYSRIHLMDDADTILQKIKKAKSDMTPGPIRYDLAARPEASNLITIYAAIQGINRAAAEAEIASDNFSGFKTRLADALIAHLSPIRGKMVELLADQAELDRILRKGTERAKAVADPILREVKETIGFPV